MSDYDDWKLDPDYGKSNKDLAIEELEAQLRLSEQERERLEKENDDLRAELDDTAAIGNGLIVENAARQTDIKYALSRLEEAQKMVKRLTDGLEEILDEVKDHYDVDPDPSGGHDDRPNIFMRLGTTIEEILHGPGYIAY